MKTAIASWQGRVAPVFDSARLVEISDSATQVNTSRESIMLAEGALQTRVSQIADAGVERLICGAISQALEALVQQRGIEVIPFIAGDINVVLQAAREEGFPQEGFFMPGCCRRARYGEGKGGGGRRGKGRCQRSGQGPSRN